MDTLRIRSWVKKYGFTVLEAPYDLMIDFEEIDAAINSIPPDERKRQL